jgi:hypothetical protein
MLRTALAYAAAVVTSFCVPLAAWAVDDQLVPGKFTMIKQGGGVKFRAQPESGTFDLPSGDPRVDGATLEVFDTGGGAGSDVYQLPGERWTRLPLGRPAKLQGYVYHGSGDASDPCTLVMVLPKSIKANCQGAAVTLDPPFTGQVGVILTIGGNRYCASYGGTTKRNDEVRTHRRLAPAPASCPTSGGGGSTSTTLAPGTTSTTIVGETTTTTIAGETTTTTITGETTTTTVVSETTTTSIPGETTTTTIAGETTTTTIAGETTTTTIVGETTTTSIPGETTTTTITGETTTTTIGGGGCCAGASFINFSTIDQPGDCGDIIDSGGMVVTNVNCAGLYTGGGGNSVPLPYDLPDLGSSTTAIASCAADVATLGPTTSAETGSLNNCTSTGCRFGAPLAVPNPGSTPTSVCVLNTLSAGASGTVDCATGTSDIAAPLSSVLFLTGDTATDPGSTIPGIQPCPLCSGTTCVGGANNGMACTPGTTNLGGNPAYPTSNDCPPDPMFNIGTLPVDFQLTSGSVTWSGSTPTNDTGSTASAQNRVFSGFCRDADGTGAFSGSTPATAQLCWQNGMAIGAACAGTFESCEQRNNGAFGPAGGANRTIIAIGNAMSILGGSGAATLVSVFSIRPTFDATVDAAGDLPGPGAVALPGTATLCTTPNPCP